MFYCKLCYYYERKKGVSMSKSQNYFAADIKSLPVNINIIAAYHSIVGPNYINEFPYRQGKISPENSFSGFIHCIDGEGVIKTINGNLFIKKNNFCFLNYAEIIEFSNTQGVWTFFCVWFNITSLSLTYNKIVTFEVTQSEKNNLLRMISLLHSESSIDHALANSICQLFICETVKRIGTTSLSSDNTKKMQKVASYIHENLHSNISAKTLASLCGYCDNHFRAIFKKFFNSNPKDYILKVKLEKAAFLLIHTNESVTAISDELSFYSTSHFIYSFKLHFGTTPIDYRKKNQPRI